MKRGRPKGYSPYTEIRYEELADWVGRKTKIPVSKKWLESLMGGSESPIKEPQESSKTKKDSDRESMVEYTITKL